jgi:uncharacterized protein
MKKHFVLITSLIACSLLYYIEQHLMVDYFIKTSAKLILFMIVPFIYVKWIKKESLKEALRLTKMKKGQFKVGLILGMSAFLVVILSYLIFKNQINLDAILSDLQNKSKITATNFIFIGLYITFINALLEEYFFRGFVFLNYYEEGNVKFAYIYSSLLFALYHIGIFQSWFNPILIVLAVFGLIVIALVFNYIDTLSKNFINSYLVHILADCAIILIGLRLFGVI